MRWQGFKIHVVIISLVVGLAAFMGAHWLYTSLNFQQPLQKQMDNNSLVASYKIVENGDRYKIIVSLRNRENMNLMQSYRQIYDKVREIMGNRPFTIELVNRPNDRLNGVLNQGRFAIHEALVKGNFREMFDALHRYARRAGVESRVYIDDDYVYWQMRDGANYLYEVVPRGVSTGGGALGLERGYDGA
ncbi:hypothetical protein [Desulfoscipio geothermicus]|uniref:Uncharacterized protein n=1 Tax=Desulfoscipio geothermicus DSM 3669 TaxID=1121426 RepID=A0A1I6D8S4_9FIRM|nr:hypothetical protein [Desulfoscipio geothermicus]SFR01865.1 hypothetical protein SAMN05660706_10777 [Desulfoscipio geothermicus DSM 3669]